MVLFSILFCVNSSVVLYAFYSKEVRSDDTSEIRHLVHCLLLKGYVQLFIGFLHAENANECITAICLAAKCET